MALSKPLIYDLDYQQLSSLLNEWREPSYRVDQVWHGVYEDFWREPVEFTNLPAHLRKLFEEHFFFSSLKPIKTVQSDDLETTKVLFALSDDLAIETVLMQYNERRTLCISTQVGCAMGCVFCATGQMGFRRELNQWRNRRAGDLLREGVETT